MNGRFASDRRPLTCGDVASCRASSARCRKANSASECAAAVAGGMPDTACSSMASSAHADASPACPTGQTRQRG